MPDGQGDKPNRPHKRGERDPRKGSQGRPPSNGKPRDAAGRSHKGGGKPKHSDDSLVVFGLHAVEAALLNPKRTLRGLYLTENAERRLGDAVTGCGLDVTRVSPRDLDRRLGAETVHQGACLEAEPPTEPTLDDMIALCGHGPLVVLDQVTDPHNVGAVLRSAAVFGASGLIMTRRNSPPLGGVLAKSASGALEVVPLHLSQNLSRTLDQLKDGGIDVIGLDGEADTKLETLAFDRPTALVFGAEGKGLRQLTAQTCTQLAAITTGDRLRSLNVSNAAAVALHTVLMKIN
ncbi:MAG: RNA methyltransferase [Pseudomonadota bacterium]